MVKRVKGTQDLLNMNRFDAFSTAARNHLENANFSHIQLPILEYVELFQHSVGQHTDIVTKEMYTFSANGKETLCLRPEGTAGTMRAFLENTVEDKPWQIFSFGPMFRHERPQKGRFRQFTQLNIESINTSSVMDDVRLISLLDDLFLHTLKLRDYVLQINFLGGPADRARHREALVSFVEKQKSAVCTTCQTRIDTNILRIFDCKNESCQSIYQNAPVITDYLGEEAQQEWQQLQQMLTTLSINHIHNPFLVRGLDYYHNTVFEFSSPLLGAQSAFCGGGQYDLSAQLGHKNPIRAVGTAIGMERLILLLEALNSDLIHQHQPLHVIIPQSDAQHDLALLAHQTLHRGGINVDLLTGGFKKAMKRANKQEAAVALIIGDDEVAAGSIRVKNMATGHEELVSQEHLLTHLQAA